MGETQLQSKPASRALYVRNSFDCSMLGMYKHARLSYRFHGNATFGNTDWNEFIPNVKIRVHVNVAVSGYTPKSL